MRKMQEIQKKKAKRYKGSILLKFALLCFACFIIGALVHQQIQISQKEEQLYAVQQALKAQNTKNDELQYNVENEENKQERMEQEARKNYNYAKPNEEVFVDIGGNS